MYLRKGLYSVSFNKIISSSMSSVKLKFRPNADNTHEGTLFFQIIHNREVKQITTGYHIYEKEWDKRCENIVLVSPIADDRNDFLREIQDKTMWERRKLERIINTLEDTRNSYTAEDIVICYKKSVDEKKSVFEYIKSQAERLMKLGRVRTSETYQQTLTSFMRFRNGADLYFDMLNADMIEHYESYLRSNYLCRNTTSFYMRVLRCIYNRAVEDGLTVQADPFKRVYTGVDKTSKRAISFIEIKRIKELDLSGKPDLEYARDMFLFSFCMRGMSFIDIAYLRKKDLSNGYVSYIRKKTGQQLTVRWEKSMQDIVDKYPENPTQYLLPVILRQGGSERKQYLSKLIFINRKLKIIARLARVTVPLSMYVSRHSWASIAKSKNVPLSVISEGMGHDSEETTRIYLATIIYADRIDDANSQILKDL